MSCRNIGIFAHVDAGKTTVSEQLLVYSGKIREAGSVDRGTAHTDDLPVERRRGISVKATCVSLQWKGTDVHLIDTPGHTDFSAEIERSFWALDAAVLVVDAVRGVQPQTETLFRALKAQGMPLLFFLNKTDREEAAPDEVLTQIRKKLTKEICPLWNPEEVAEYVCGTSDELTTRWLEGENVPPEEIRGTLARLTAAGQACPVLRGSALRGRGITELLDAMVTYLPGPDTSEKELCGVAFAAAQDRNMGRGLWIRLYGGSLENRMTLEVRKGTDRITGEPVLVQLKISQIRNAAGEDIGVLSAGGVGIVYGLGDLEIGHVFGNPEKLPRKVQPGTLRTPLMTVRAVPEDPADMQRLREACAALSSEDPLLRARYVKTTGEMILQIMGKVQLEIAFAAPAGCAGRIISDVQQMRGDVTDSSADEETVTLRALVPAASFMDYPVKFASLTGGRGSMSTSLHGYRECPIELGKTSSRRGVDPLDTAKYILAARSALEGNIFDE